MKKTLLIKLSELGYDEKKSKALLMAEHVRVNGEVQKLSSLKISDTDIVTVKDSKEFVSRGAYKLLSAIEKFNINLVDKNVIDIGSSTGGFTQISLLKGAKHVYALDSGTNQLDYSLRSNNKVTSMEKTNLKDIKNSMFSEGLDFAVCDVSFISLKNVFKVLSEQFDSLPLMALIKPQFEANSDQVQEGGFVPETLHKEIIEKVISFAKQFGYEIKMIEKSPIEGGVSKNIEYISLFERG